MGRTIEVNPVTRIEGHAKVFLDLDDAGQVVSGHLQVLEIRGFEKLLDKMELFKMPLITARICGVCPVPHHLAAVQAIETGLGVAIPDHAKLLRELLCLGGIVYFWKTRDTRNWNPLLHVVVPLIGAVVFGAALYGSIHPAPPGILKYTPYVALVWLVIGLGVLVYVRTTRPDKVAQIGSILGEEGGTDAAILDR